jgi:phosphoribosylanthranilate isomerase
VTSPRVKICGVTRPEDAALAARLGADAIGLNFWPRSRRHVDAASAREIVRALPPLVLAVGVFVDQPLEDVRAIAREVGLGAVQLHGAEGRRDCDALAPLPVLKAFRCGAGDDLAGPPFVDHLAAYEGAVAGVLLDAAASGYGGTGARCDWALAAEVARRVPVLLAGGLDPENVADAIRAVRPWAVDVASGVERAPGVKDPEKLAAFIRRAKETT